MTDNEYFKNCLLKDVETEMETLKRLESLKVKNILRASRSNDGGFDQRGIKGELDSEPKPFRNDINIIMRQARENDPDGGWNGNAGSWN